MGETLYRAIPGFDGYRAGNDGTIRSCRGRWGAVAWHRLRPCVNERNRYLYVVLHRDGRQDSRAVHSLILLAFVGPPQDGLVARHKNGDRADARLENLHYGTPAENEADKQAHGTYRAGESVRHFVRLTADKVRAIRRDFAGGKSLTALGRLYGTCVGNVHAIVSGRT
jgi:hypothetical protein